MKAGGREKQGSLKALGFTAFNTNLRITISPGY
ncbi:MAG: hypothetical protein ACI845_000346 [Gammaproteobacteria bacterium]|jgi:hypothetical protein